MYDDMVRKLENQEEDGLEVRTYFFVLIHTYIFTHTPELYTYVCMYSYNGNVRT